jgi:hypothetical protein
MDFVEMLFAPVHLPHGNNFSDVSKLMIMGLEDYLSLFR